MELHFEAYGQGEPLIILHGLFGSLQNWHSMSTKLAAHFNVFALDQRNHGRSPHLPTMDYPSMAADVLDFMRSRGLADAFVLGHSMGGKTAMQLALQHPNAVRKLVVVDIAPRSYPPHHNRMMEGMLSLDLARFQTRNELEAALAPTVPDLSTRQFLLKNAVREPLGGFCWRIGLHEILENYPRLTEAIDSSEPCRKEALFIRGEKSDYLLESDLDLIRRLFSRANFQTISAAGHLPHVENPDAFAAAIVAFLLQD